MERGKWEMAQIRRAQRRLAGRIAAWIATIFESITDCVLAVGDGELMSEPAFRYRNEKLYQTT
jgi:hypothetical protein